MKIVFIFECFRLINKKTHAEAQRTQSSFSTLDLHEYFIDLLLYHRELRCLIAVELKIGEFLPEYVGKMQFYPAVMNDPVKLADENPTIGIILCKDKDKTIVEYALKRSTSPVGIAEYKLVSILPAKLQKQLPASEQIAKILDIIE